MIVALGSTREPKIRAAYRALNLIRERVPAFLQEDYELVSRSAPSGTSPTPQSTSELMAGAKNRAEALIRTLSLESRPPDLSIGLEGGIGSESGLGGQSRLFYLESWAYVTNGRRGVFGSSGCLPLPDAVIEAVVNRGEDLGPVADKLFEQEDVAGHQGTFGILTADLITREDAFVRSLLHALAPFYNQAAYRAKER
jgi:inosine/xanthosine triphosphatase